MRQIPLSVFSMEAQSTGAASPVLSAAAVSSEFETLNDRFLVGCSSKPIGSSLPSQIENRGTDSLPGSSPILSIKTLQRPSSPSIENVETLSDKILPPSSILVQPLADANESDGDNVDAYYSPMQIEPEKEGSGSSSLRLVDEEDDYDGYHDEANHDSLYTRHASCSNPFYSRELGIEYDGQFNVRPCAHHERVGHDLRYGCQSRRGWPCAGPSCSSQEDEGDSIPFSSQQRSPKRNRERREDGHSGFVIPVREDRPTGVGAGLSNLGNTCFVNAILQCFTHTVPLVKAIHSCYHAVPCERASDGFCALCALRDHIELSLASSGKIISPSKLIDNLNYISPFFHRYQQEDAHEFLQCLLDRLERCCLDSSPSDENSCSRNRNIVQQVFGGRLVSKLRCCNCDYSSDKYEPLIDLSLEMREDADTLQSILESFTKVEKIEESFACENCNETVSRSKQLMLDQVPSVVTLHLKRFKVDGSIVEKIGKHVEFPLELDFKPYASSTEDSDVDLKYQLYAVVVHDGFLPTAGHYFCYIRSSQDTWHKLDDSKVIKAQQEFVLSQSAYILLYAREGTPWFSSLTEPEELCSDPTISNASPKSVLDNIDGERTLCLSAAEGISPLFSQVKMLEGVIGTKGETMSIEVQISAQASTDAPMVDISEPFGANDCREVFHSEKLCALSSVEETNFDHRARRTGTGLHPPTPSRSPSLEMNPGGLPGARYDIPRGHLKVENHVNCKRSSKKVIKDAQRLEALRYLKSMPIPRRSKLLMAAMIPRNGRNGVRSSRCKKASFPISRRKLMRLALSR